MAGKRSASSDINHDNWDNDEKPEEAGSFERAPEDQLRARVMKTARRRNPISSVRNHEEASKPSVFSGFTGFSKPTTTTTSSVFAFLTTLTDSSKTNNLPESKEKVTPSTFTTPSIVVDLDKKTQAYYSKLTGLNESVSKWIKTHVESNPLIDLQPIFRDYEKYMKEIEAEKESTEEVRAVSDKKQEPQTQAMNSFVFKPAENVPDSTTEKDRQDGGKEEADKVTPSFNFGSNAAASTSTNIPTFNFGSKTPMTNSNKFSFGACSTASTITIPSSFSFGSTSSTSSSFSLSAGSSPLVLSGTKPPTSSESEGAKKTTVEEEDDDCILVEPQLAKVVESDHIYTTRCKVFKKKDDRYIVCGVGDLYVKPIEKSEKVQVIVRADNNLGTLLCNFVLSASIPTKKMGGKDVMLVCLMTPDMKPPPVPIIIRVKTNEEADRLLEVLEKNKK